jgi:type I restriction enzyme S subunit
MSPRGWNRLSASKWSDSMSEWTERRLEDVVQLKRGFDLATRDRRQGPFPVVGSAGISGWHDAGPIPGPALVLGRAGSSMGVATYCETERFWPLNTSLFVEDFKGNDPRFLFHLFQLTDLTGYNSGSAQPMLNRNYIRDVVFLMPDVEDQRAISDVLKALDDKIAVNNRIIESCDELRSLGFHRWIRKHADLVDERPLSSLATFVNGRAFTKNSTGTGRMVIRIAEINSGPSASTIYNDIDVSDQYLAHPGDVLFAWSGSLGVARWFRDTGIINQHIFKVIPGSGVPKWLAYELINEKLVMFKGVAADKATTMGHIQRHHLDEIAFVPSPSEVVRLDAELGPLWERALSAERESLKLAELRDTLLPKLMSGQIRVRGAEKVVEDVT